MIAMIATTHGGSSSFRHRRMDGGFNHPNNSKHPIKWHGKVSSSPVATLRLAEHAASAIFLLFLGRIIPVPKGGGKTSTGSQFGAVRCGASQSSSG
mmetsp:Transcript_20050/g.22187  ORF Transcript_20050/g.22187 Transcript_20050/m.22187 type:complete len:96 (-) Transcript_20050:442-729(-)